MAREGKKLELYEILAAKKAKGKVSLGVDAKPARQANSEPEETFAAAGIPEEIMDGPGLIVDDAIAAEAPRIYAHPQTAAQSGRDDRVRRPREKKNAASAPPHGTPEPAAAEPPRPRSSREVVFALDTAFIFFTVALALIGSSYFLGYKRGQEERPTGMAGVADIDAADPGRINIRNLAPPPRSATRPAEQDWTLVLRTEPASDDLPERLELELAEAVARGRQESGREAPGFIFRTAGNNPLYILAVGLGKTANDEELNDLFKIYNRMEGMTFSRVPRPYIGCSIAPVRELGTAVY